MRLGLRRLEFGVACLFISIFFANVEPEFYSTEDGEVRFVARPLKENVAVVSACRRATAWEMSLGLDAMQMMAQHVLNFFCTLYKVGELCKKCRNAELDVWFLL